MQGTIKLSQIFALNKENTDTLHKSKKSADPIIKEIDLVLKDLKAVQARFDFETESEMIDSCIYEEHALLSRYSYLISVAKKRGLRCEYSQNLLLNR